MDTSMMEKLTCGRRQEQPRHKKWLEKSILEKNRLLNTLARALCVQGRRGLRSCSVRSHQIEALQVLQRANRNILVGGTSGGVLPSCSCLPAQSVPAIAISCHSLLLLGADGNKVRPWWSTVGRLKTVKAATVPSSWAPA